MLNSEIISQAESILTLARNQKFRLVTAESCTGGLIAGALTAVAGSSDVVDRGFVTYSNEAKAEMLGVPTEMLAEHGAVSEPVARAMAYGALVNSLADVSVAVTGIAGPGGGSDEKPVGLVHLISVSDQFARPNQGRNRIPTRQPASAEIIQTQPCRLIEATPEKNAPILQPNPTRAP